MLKILRFMLFLLFILPDYIVAANKSIQNIDYLPHTVEWLWG